MILWLPGTPEPGNSQPCFLGSYVVWHHAELCLWIMTLHPAVTQWLGGRRVDSLAEETAALHEYGMSVSVL